MKKIISVSMAILLVVVFFTACNSSPEVSPSSNTSQEVTVESSDTSVPSQEVKKFTIGIVPYFLSDQFCKWLVSSFETTLQNEYPNIEYKIIDGQGKVDTTIAALEQFTAEKVDLIILQPFDADAFVPSVKNAIDAGISVVCTNVGINDDGLTPYVIGDFKAQGYAQGDYLKDKIPENAEIAIILGAPVAPAQMRRDGLQEALLDERKDLLVVAELNANWRKDEAMQITEDWLLRFPNLQFILAQSDEMAMGAIEALRAVNKIGEIQVAGIGGTAQGCVAIQNGELYMSVFEDAKAFADLTLELAWKILNGEEYEKANYIPNPIVNSANVDDYLAMHEAAGNLNQ